MTGSFFPMVPLKKTNLPSFQRSLGIAILALAMVGTGGLRGQNSKPTEYQVKAAYLSNFGRFVDWPERTGGASTFQVCVLGQDPFGPALDAAVSGESIRGAPLAARRISRTQDATGCRVLFVSSSEERQLTEILAAMDRSPVLTVSDIAQFVRRGGMIQFVVEGARVRFEVNLTASRNAGLSLSSEMLKLALAVRK